MGEPNIAVKFDDEAFLNMGKEVLIIGVCFLLLELFRYCEKMNQLVAHQFRDALVRMIDYCNGTTNIVDVMHLVCSHF